MNPWHENAEFLGAWAMLMAVNREDAFGAYFEQDGQVKSYTDKKRHVTLERLTKAFRAEHCRDLIGLHALGTDNFGKWAALDIDLHDGDTVTQDQTLKYAAEVYSKLYRRGFQPILTESNGKGGFHVRVHFKEPVPGEVLFRFARWMSRGWEHKLDKQPETFPKQPFIEPGKFGNWLRLFGRHHKRDFYPKVMVGHHWLEGQEAIDHILTLTGVSGDKIPMESQQDEKPRVVRSEWTAARGSGSELKPWEEFDRRTDWESMLTGWGWKSAGRGGGISYYTRPLKDQGISASVGHKFEGKVPLLFVFTTNADPLPTWRYYTPSAAYAYYAHGGDFKAAARDLRSKGYGG